MFRAALHLGKGKEECQSPKKIESATGSIHGSPLALKELG
jgi:hypothetical protein